MAKDEKIPGWFGWILDRSLFFWRGILLIAAVGFLTLAVMINARIQHLEQNLSFQSPQGGGHVDVVAIPDVIAKGQTLFVPAYSHVYHQDGKPFPLTATLSVHNTDRKEPIVVTAADYYSTDGKLIRRYAEQPKQIAPLSSLEFLVNEQDTEGGSGAKFVVRWVAQTQVHEPLIQTVMVGTTGGQGLSFVGNSVVLEEVDEE